MSVSKVKSAKNSIKNVQAKLQKIARDIVVDEERPEENNAPSPEEVKDILVDVEEMVGEVVDGLEELTEGDEEEGEREDEEEREGRRHGARRMAKEDEEEEKEKKKKDARNRLEDSENEVESKGERGEKKNIQKEGRRKRDAVDEDTEEQAEDIRKMEAKNAKLELRIAEMEDEKEDEKKEKVAKAYSELYSINQKSAKFNEFMNKNISLKQLSNQFKAAKEVVYSNRGNPQMTIFKEGKQQNASMGRTFSGIYPADGKARTMSDI